MKPRRDLPIEQQLRMMALRICGAILFVAISSLLTFQVLTFRSNFQHDAVTLAAVIANNSAAAMSFKNEEAATEMMRSLHARPTVVAACLAWPNGSLFAHFGNAEEAKALPQFPPAGGYRFTGRHLLVTQPVKWKGDQVGTLYLRSDYQQTFLSQLRFYGLVLVGITIVSISLSSFLSSRLGGGITGPILQLARTAQMVGEKKDYSMRAAVTSRGDEVGRLAESFNEMLGCIQNQDAALSWSQRRMKALIESVDGIVWECTPDRTRFTFISRQSERILGYEPEAWQGTPDFWEEKLDPDDAAKAVETGRDLATRGLPYSFEYRIMAADGRSVWIRESGTVLVEKGEPVAIRGIFQDITRHKLDSEKLDRLNRQLVDNSRQAGMAEVATGVLHNVGNVLNSVSVSATLVTDRLRHSKVDKLRQATALLRDQNGQLAEFLTNDPKGKLLPAYLDTVADQLAGEQTGLITLMTTVGQHIEHIKEIVAMQQTYARVSGVYENLAAATLVEDALRMKAAAFERHHIDLVREFDQDLPLVCVDRHKVLQILINLLSNARYALSTKSADNKQIVIRLQLASPERVRITVSDNGVGIAPEHLTLIFNHGFTTKKDGHGFGLHSGANAAKEMGGSLTAHSDGPGKGAEFALELPVAASPRQEEHPAIQGVA